LIDQLREFVACWTAELVRKGLKSKNLIAINLLIDFLQLWEFWCTDQLSFSSLLVFWIMSDFWSTKVQVRSQINWWMEELQRYAETCYWNPYSNWKISRYYLIQQTWKFEATHLWKSKPQKLFLMKYHLHSFQKDWIWH